MPGLDQEFFNEMIYDIKLEVATCLDLRVAYGLPPRSSEEKWIHLALPQSVRNSWGYVYRG